MGPSSILYPDSTPDIPTQQLSLCLRKSEDILFYQYRVTSEDTTRTEDTFEYAIENLETGEVELHVWTLSEGTYHIHLKRVHAPINTHYHCLTYKILKLQFTTYH